MQSFPTPIPSNTWIATTWDDYLPCDRPHPKRYDHNGQRRMSGRAALGNPHSRDHDRDLSIVIASPTRTGYGSEGQTARRGRVPQSYFQIWERQSLV